MFLTIHHFHYYIGILTCYIYSFPASTLPPFVSKGPQTTYIVKENETLSIPCEVSSTPAATITWYKDSVAISNTDARLKISTNKIELVNIQSHHDGEYYCKASNTFGVTESDKGKVFVQCKLS